MGFQLHLIHPLGFAWDDKRLKRAGMDYEEFAEVQHHDDWDAFKTWLTDKGRLFALSTRGTQSYCAPKFQAEDVLLFGPETRGLPQKVLDGLPMDQRLRLPMKANSRSLNLSNTVAIMAYESWRQQDFIGADC